MTDYVQTGGTSLGKLTQPNLLIQAGVGSRVLWSSLDSEPDNDGGRSEGTATMELP